MKACLYIVLAVVVILLVFLLWQATLLALHCWNEWQLQLQHVQHVKTTGQRYKRHKHCTNMRIRREDERAGLKDCSRAELFSEMDTTSEARRLYIRKSLVGHVIQLIRSNLVIMFYIGIAIGVVSITTVSVVLC